MHVFAKKIEIFTKDGVRLAIHQRRFGGRRYVTDSEHMPEKHRAVVEFRGYDGKYYRARAHAIGEHTGAVVERLLADADFEEQAFKSCMGIIRFSRTYGDIRLERACEKAIALNSVSYSTLKNILKNGQDSQPAAVTPDAETPTPYHENLRVGEWE